MARLDLPPPNPAAPDAARTRRRDSTTKGEAVAHIRGFVDPRRGDEGRVCRVSGGTEGKSGWLAWPF